MISDICKTEGDQVLLVEGKNDCHVILALCNYFKIPEVFGIYDCENDEGVLKRFNALILKPDGPKTIGIVVDADNPDALGRWQQIKKKISHHGYSFPETPDAYGTVLNNTSNNPNIGIWLMPNNNDSGMLEDFLLPMADQRAVTIARNCLENARDNHAVNFKEKHYSKALIHTYLAWQDEPGRPLGQSITSLILKPETADSIAFMGWLKRLFFPS